MNIRQVKHYSPQDIFQYTKIGVVMEFYCSKDSNFIIEDLSKVSTKTVKLSLNENDSPSFTTAILHKEYDSKKSRYSFKLATQDYLSIQPIIQNINQWLSENAQTTLNTLMKVILTFDERHLQTFRSISEMDITRLILKLDESYIYSRLEEQVNSPFAISIKKMLKPVNGYVNMRRLAMSTNYDFVLPKENYFSVNFQSQPMGVLEFNYIGGKDYPSKQTEINEILEYYVIKTYQSLNETNYTKFEIDEMDKITKNYEKAQNSFYDINEFVKLYPGIKLNVDLRNNTELLKVYWPDIKNKVFEILTNCNFVKGSINYDSMMGKFQIKDAELNGTLLKGYELFKCKLSGILKECQIWNCEINNSRIYNSTLVGGNKVNKSYLYSVCANHNNKLNECYIINDNEILNCEINESIIKFAGLGKNAKINENCVIIHKKEVPIINNKGIEINEIRDYNWLKYMDKTRVDISGYCNEYKRKR